MLYLKAPLGGNTNSRVKVITIQTIMYEICERQTNIIF